MAAKKKAPLATKQTSSIPADRLVELALAPYARAGEPRWMLTARHAPLAPSELIALLDHPAAVARGVTRVELVRERTVAGFDTPFADADLERLASMPALARVAELHVEDARVTKRGAAAIATSPYASALEHLSFDGVPLGDDGAGALSTGTFRDRLRSLSLINAGIGAKGVAAIAGSFGRLESLDLKWNEPKDGGLKALSQAAFAGSLRDLRLQGASGFSAPALAALGGSKLFEHLASLDLTACKLGKGAIDLFAAGAPSLSRLHADSADGGLPAALGPLRALRSLSLGGVGFGDKGAEALAKSGVIERLEALHLSANGLSDKGLRALLAVEAPRLRDLAVFGNRKGSDTAQALATATLPALETLRMGDLALAGARAFAKRDWPKLSALALEWFMGEEDVTAALAALAAPIGTLDVHFRALSGPSARRLVGAWAPALRALRLYYTGSGADVAKAIAETPLPALRALDLSGNRIAPEGVAAIAAAPFAGQLASLVLRSSEIGADGARAIAGGSFSSLEWLDLAFSAIGDEGALALAESQGLSSVRRLDARHGGIGAAAAAALARSTSLESLREVDIGPVDRDGAEIGDLLARARAGRLVVTGAAQRVDDGVEAIGARYGAG